MRYENLEAEEANIMSIRFRSQIKPLYVATSGAFAIGAASASAETVLEEVVVTALKRSENLQEVPIKSDHFTQ